MPTRRVTFTHKNAHTRDELAKYMSETLDAEGVIHFVTKVDRDPTDDAFAFILSTVTGECKRVTVEDEA